MKRRLAAAALTAGADPVIKRILIALDGAPSSGVAVKRGLELATAHGAALVAVPLMRVQAWKHGLSPFMTTGEAMRLVESRPWDAEAHRLESVLSGFRRSCEGVGVAYEVKAGPTTPLEALESAWRTCDLLVLGLGGLLDSYNRPDPAGGVSQLIRKGVRPLLAESDTYRPIRRVLVAYSGSIESAKAMKRYVQMRLWADAPLTIVCFGKPPSEARELLESAEAYCLAHGFQAEARAVDGPAGQALLPTARRAEADLIVAGDGFRHTAIQEIMGDTAAGLIRDTDRSLFLSH